MEKEICNQDLLGRKFGCDYSNVILPDYTLEKRLKAYDPNLKLMFDQNTKRWKILEWERDNSGWRVLMSCEDDFGNAAAPGEWVFSHLNEMRLRAEERNKNSDNWFNGLISSAESYKAERQRKLSEEAQYRVRHDIILWRRAFADAMNLPISDATAGFQFQPSHKPKERGIVCP